MTTAERLNEIHDEWQRVDDENPQLREIETDEEFVLAQLESLKFAAREAVKWAPVRKLGQCTLQEEANFVVAIDFLRRKLKELG